MRRRALLFWIIIAFFVVFIVARLGDLGSLARTLASARPEWVAVAALTQVVYFGLVALMYVRAMRAVGIHYGVAGMLPVVLGSLFVSGVTPAGEPGGLALFLDDAKRRGNPPARAAAGALLGQIGYYVGLSVVLVFGFAHLIARHAVGVIEIASASALAAVMAFLVFALLLGAQRPRALLRLMELVQRSIDRISNRVVRRDVMPNGWALSTALDFSEASLFATRSPGGLAVLLLVALASTIPDIGTMWALFLAFGQRPDVGTIIAAFAVTMALWSVLPFQGIGLVEASTVIVLASLGMTSGPATLISLSFRGLAFWIPLALGFLLLRRTESFRPPASDSGRPK